MPTITSFIADVITEIEALAETHGWRLDRQKLIRHYVAGRTDAEYLIQTQHDRRGVTWALYLEKFRVKNKPSQRRRRETLPEPPPRRLRVNAPSPLTIWEQHTESVIKGRVEDEVNKRIADFAADIGTHFFTNKEDRSAFSSWFRSYMANRRHSEKPLKKIGKKVKLQKVEPIDEPLYFPEEADDETFSFDG